VSESSAPILRAVLDTNVVVSGLILSQGVPFEILEAWRRQAFVWVTSEAILAELVRVLQRPKFRDVYGIADSARERLAALIQASALIVPGHYAVSGVSADPDDDKFLACALEAQADCVVTGDKHLLSLHPYQGLALLRPAEFLARLSPGAPTE
jgi:putative PIN family toxin of toxin-antitoxin system